MVTESLQAQLRINSVRIACHLFRDHKFQVHALVPHGIRKGHYELRRSATKHDRHVAADWLKIRLCAEDDFSSGSVSGWILVGRL